MGLAPTVKQKRFFYRPNWSHLGIALAVLFGSITIYSAFFKDTRPHLVYEIVSSASVLDVREHVANLNIIYNGVNLKKWKQSLRIIILRVENDGNEDILKTYYDDKAPLGFSVTNGRIIQADLNYASNPYLAKNLHVILSQSNSATFSPVILESQQFFAVKILILHLETNEPKIKPEGKVARVNSIKLISAEESEKRIPFWMAAFSGSPVIQAFRLIAYFTVAYLLLNGVLILGTTIRGQFSRIIRRLKVRRYKAALPNKPTDLDEMIFDYYLFSGPDVLTKINNRLSNPSFLNDIMNAAKTDKMKNLCGKERFEEIKTMAHELDLFGRLTIVNGKYEVDKEDKERLTMFLRHIQGKK